MAVEAARCGIWEWDLAADTIFMSEVTANLFGWRSGQVEGQQVLDRVAPAHRDDIREALSTAAIYGDFDVSFRVPPLAGARPVWIDFRGRGFGEAPEGGFAKIIGVALDVTEERLAQARAQSAESRLRDAIESTSEAFVLWDRHGRLVMCNKNFRSYFQLEGDALKAGAERESVERAGRAAIRQEYPAPGGRRGVREAELTDGRWVQISERPTAEGGLVVTAADITVLKTQEEARRIKEEELRRAVINLERSQEQLSELARKYEAEKVKAESANATKSDFLASMSRELRPSLNAINSNVEALVTQRYGPIGNNKYQEISGSVLSAGMQLLSMINDMLDMANIEEGKRKLRFEAVDILDVIIEAVGISRARIESSDGADDIDIEVEARRLPEVEADYRAIKYVLITLITNAIRGASRNGGVSIVAELSHDRDGDILKICVASNNRNERVANETASQHVHRLIGGDGSQSELGLALTKSIIEMHGGVLELAGSIAGGAIATFTVPVRHIDPVPRSSSRRVVGR